MAFARLFGKNKKDPSPGDHYEREGEDGRRGGSRSDQSWIVLQGLLCWSLGRQVVIILQFIQGLIIIIISKSNNCVLLSLSTANLPYLLPGGPPGAVGVQRGHGAGGAGQEGGSMPIKQQSNTNPLDGVHFTLSPR